VVKTNKFCIGLTGNIATGKSTVRRLLERCGAFTVDADKLSHRAMKIGAPGYNPIIRAFGDTILDENKEIDRRKLGKIVFSDPRSLNALEKILHPLVGSARRNLVRLINHPIFVFEAIKLFESGLAKTCQTNWVTCSDPDVQLERLIIERSMDAKQAQNLIDLQLPQQKKIERADFILENNAGIHALELQVVEGWNTLIPEEIHDSIDRTRRKKFQGLEFESIDFCRIPNREAFYNMDWPGFSTLPEPLTRDGYDLNSTLIIRDTGQIIGRVSWRIENFNRWIEHVDYTQDLNSSKVGTIFKFMEQKTRSAFCETLIIRESSVQEDLYPVLRDLGYELWHHKEHNKRKRAGLIAIEATKDQSIFFKRTMPPDRISALFSAAGDSDD
jgi:dephospho-CoA kinase